MQPTLSQEEQKIAELTKKLQASEKRLRDLGIRHLILLFLFIVSTIFSIHMFRKGTVLMGTVSGDLKSTIDLLNRETKYTAGLRDILHNEFHCDCKMAKDGMASCEMSKQPNKSTPPTQPAVPIMPRRNNNDPTI
jgi:hypothetical protein